jgi:DNA modification methylase
VAGQIGLEPTPEEYVATLVAVFREVRRVLRDDGTVWLNLGDSYSSGGRETQTTDTFRRPAQVVDGKRLSGPRTRGVDGDAASGKQAHLNGTAVRPGNVPGLKPKDLIGVPWRVAFALQADGWYLRSDIIWAKPNPMPESVTDRPTKSHEHVFLLSKSARYFYDAVAVRERAMGQNGHDLTGPGYTAPGQTPQRGNRRTDKQRGHSRRHAGFNDRWDAMSKVEQSANGRNLRDVWTIATQPMRSVPVGRWEDVGVDAVGDGIRRTTSRDCSLHGDLADLAATVSDDGRASLSPGESRSPSMFGHPGPGRSVEPVPTAQPPVVGSGDGSSDSPPPSHSHAAIDRSSRSRRTARDHGTTTPCTPSAGTPDHTGGTSGSRAIDERSVRTPGSSSEPAVSGDPPSERILGRTSDRSSCTCSYRRWVSKSISHFATFPEALVEPCVKAGCPEGGVILDPFAGTGTVGVVANRLSRRAVLIDLNPDYIGQLEERNRQALLGLVST